MALSLNNLSFKVTKKLNASKREIEEAINGFGRELRKGGVGLFYFAGHGVQVNGINYLIPIGANIESEGDVRYEAVNANRVLSKMQDAGNPLNMVFLDACRNNPFARRFRSTEQGLAPMDAPKGSFVAYATAPGDVAAEGDSRNGIFTKHLLQYMREPGLEVGQMMRKVRTGVQNDTSGKQTPFEVSSLTGNFYFASRRSDIPPEQSSVDTDALPPEGSASFSDILKTAEERKKAIEAWNRWQNERTGEYSEAKRIDTDRYLTPTKKAEAWQRFLSVVSRDNPHSTEDNEMRSYAQSRVAHWGNVKPSNGKKPTPKTADMKKTWKDPVTGMEFVWVPGECYEMGCGSWTSDCYDNEKPVHEVCVDGFWIGKYEVTQGQWKKVMGNNPARFKKGDDYPVEKVSWDDAKTFIGKLNSSSGGGYRFRLPTEAEWEYAARAGTTTVRYWGDDPDDACRYANVHDQTSKRINKFYWPHHNCDDGYAVTAPAGSFQPNAFGLYDMLGNVWEWCEDIYSADAYRKHQRNNPIYTEGGSDRVIRGGSWCTEPGGVRSAYRDNFAPVYRNYDVGFRLLRTK